MELLQGKTGLVFGVANERSYAWHIAKALVEHGAQCAFGCLPGEKNEARARFAVEALGIEDPWIRPCNVAVDGDLDALFLAYGRDHRRLDFIIHSIAFADREWLSRGRFVDTPRAAFHQALDISSFSLMALARCGREQMAAAGGGSILAMTYYGAEKVVPGYNVMGVAKAALECAARYLAEELGPFNIRVNTISGGPLRTLAASAVGGVKEMLSQADKRAPLRHSMSGGEVGDTAVYLVSDLARGLTGENMHVDYGLHVMGA